MLSRKTGRFRRNGLALLVILTLIGLTFPVHATELNVALYPYVPRPDQFKTVLSASWNRIHPDVPLNFVTWDCYSADPPSSLDVFVFDAIFLSSFQARGYLDPIQRCEIDGVDDYLSFALEGCRLGQAYGAIPQLACTHVLFYRKGDDEIARAETLSGLTRVLGEHTYTGIVPPEGVGLMVNLSGKSTDACLYVDALEDIYGVYTSDPPLAPDASKICSWSIQNLRQVLRMASVTNAQYSDSDSYIRGEWFGAGYGRALVGFTESISVMSDRGRQTVAFKPMPLADRTNVCLFYADVIGIHPATRDRGTRSLALELANLMASTSVVVDSIGPRTGAPYPQYLLPTRHSVFRSLELAFPLYAEMYEMVKSDEAVLFRLGADGRAWLPAMKAVIYRLIFE